MCDTLFRINFFRPASARDWLTAHRVVIRQKGLDYSEAFFRALCNVFLSVMQSCEERAMQSPNGILRMPIEIIVRLNVLEILATRCLTLLLIARVFVLVAMVPYSLIGKINRDVNFIGDFN